jgi:zinc protease
LQIQGLPADYVTNRNDYIEAVTREDVARVARRLMDSDALRFVVVGRPEGVVSTD